MSETLAVLTAPEYLWLCISDEVSHYDEPFPKDLSEVTWATDHCPVACGVGYVRGDMYREKIAALTAENTRLRDALTFDALRVANVERAKQWNPSGNIVPLSFAMMELAGETGEACNEAKKLARHDLGLVGGKTDKAPLAEELADVVICADLAAIKAGIDLAEAVAAKFNKTSDKYGFTIKLAVLNPEAKP